MREILTIETGGRGLYDLTADAGRILEDSGVREGQCHCFIRHTSASRGPSNPSQRIRDGALARAGQGARSVV